jgi:tripartite-type tricarboxylate transporter receptor subunit TctC
VSQPALAEGYPSKPITIVVGSSAGSTTDGLARAVGAEITKEVGQPVIVESKAGASGAIAADALVVFVEVPGVPQALRDSDRVTLQAHRASATWETRTAMGEMVLAGIAQALAGQRPEMSLTT